MNKALITCALIVFLTLGGLAVLIVWLADKMKPPTFSIEQGAINGYDLDANNRLNATFTLIVRSHNRDQKYNIHYNIVVVSVYHNGYTLAYDTLGTYKQAHGDYLMITAKPVARNELVSESDVAGSIRNETNSGQLTLEVRVRAEVKYEVKRWKHRSYILKVICIPVVINITTGKTIQRTNCDLDWF